MLFAPLGSEIAGEVIETGEGVKQLSKVILIQKTKTKHLLQSMYKHNLK